MSFKDTNSGVDMTVITGTGEQELKGYKAQAEVLDMHAVDGLIIELREAQTYGYEYADIKKFERGLLAIASLQGLTNVLNIEDAIHALANRGSVSKQVEVTLVNEEQVGIIGDTLTDVSNVLTKVPGQRELAQRAIHTAQLLNDIETTTVVVVEQVEEV
jgi:hypothetical protein